MSFSISPNYYLGATNNGSYSVGAVGLNATMIVSTLPIGTCTGFMLAGNSIGTDYQIVSSIYSLGTLGTRASDIPLVEGTATIPNNAGLNQYSVGTLTLNTPLVLTQGTALANIITGTEGASFTILAGNSQKLSTSMPQAYNTANRQATWGITNVQNPIPLIPIYNNGAGPFNPLKDYEKPIYAIGNHTSFSASGTGNIYGNEITVPSGSTAHSIAVGVNQNGATEWDVGLFDTSNNIVLGPFRQYRNVVSQTNPCPVNIIPLVTPTVLNNSRYRIITQSVNGNITLGTCQVKGTNGSGKFFLENFSAIGTTGTGFRGTKTGSTYTIGGYLDGIYDMKLIYEPPVTTSTSASVSGESISLFF